MLTYARQQVLALYREVRELEQPPTPSDNMDKYWQIESEYYKESDILACFEAYKVPE